MGSAGAQRDEPDEPDDPAQAQVIVHRREAITSRFVSRLRCEASSGESMS
jgi:hypothetical protein